MKTDLIEAQDLVLHLQGKSVLQGVSLKLYPRQLVTLIGPNGSGKSTLIKVLLGLIRPDQGKVTRKPGLKIGYMPQKLHMDSTLPITVEGFLKLSANISEILPVLEKTGMCERRHSLMHTLSGGEFQRTLMAKALLKKPDLLVLDEPVQGVDMIGQTEIYRLIQEIRDNLGCGILLVSHDLHFVHAASDQVICLNHHICCQGQPEDVRKNPAYLSLFGQNVPAAMAPYLHSHDHRHDDGCHEIKKDM